MELDFIAKETQIRSNMSFAVNQFSCFQCQKNSNCRTFKIMHISICLYAYPKLASLQISLKLSPMVLAGYHIADCGSPREAWIRVHHGLRSRHQSKCIVLYTKQDNGPLPGSQLDSRLPSVCQLTISEKLVRTATKDLPSEPRLPAT